MSASTSTPSTAPQEIEVLFFAQAKEAAQQPALRLPFLEEETVGGLRKRLVQELPRLATILPHCLFAINEAYASENSIIPAAAKVACIPPVSGG